MKQLLKHTSIHLFSVLAIVALGFLVGHFALNARLTNPATGELISSTGSTDTTSLVTGTSGGNTSGAGAALGGETTLNGVSTSGTAGDQSQLTQTTQIQQTAKIDVTYSVLLAFEAAFCISNIRNTPVGFIASPIAGGYFEVTYPTGEKNMLEPGQLPLPNGSYHWEAVAREGYSISGPAQGDFNLSGDCKNVSTTNPYATTASEDATDGVVTPVPVVSGSGTSTQAISRAPAPSPVPVAPTTTVVRAVTNNSGLVTTLSSTTKDIPLITGRIATKIFVDDRELRKNEHSGAIEISGNEAELRIVVQKAKTVTFVLLSKENKKTKFDADIDRLLSRDNEDVWTYYLDTGILATSSYTLFAILTDQNGNKFESMPVDILKATAAITDNATTTTISIEQERLIDGVTRKERDDILVRVTSANACTTPTECRVYCDSTLDRARECAKYVVTESVASSTNQVSFGESVLAERLGARQFVDGDGDGISDFDEVNVYRTNPNLPDSDKDGVTDGNEILAHTNPIGENNENTSSTPGEGVLLENPKDSGVIRTDLLAVNTVAVGATSSQPDGTVKADKLVFTGRALPNSFVTLYIFSDPIVVTVKTDASGAWSYTLAKELPDGTHQVYTTINDSSGKILAKSEPLPFVKQAAAVSIGDQPILTKKESPGFFSFSSVLALAALLIGVLGIAISVIGITVHHQHEARHQAS